MNEVDKHPTDETCNFCGGNVVSQYGRRSCDNPHCDAFGHSEPPHYDQDPPEDSNRTIRRKELWSGAELPCQWSDVIEYETTDDGIVIWYLD